MKMICSVKIINETYSFAKKLYNAFIDHMDPIYATEEYYDRITKIVEEEKGNTYFQASDLSYENRDTYDFKTYWKFKPLFKVMDSRDSLQNSAVFCMLFVFIAIICFSAVFVIVYTRCITIALNNAPIYQDLSKLGANRTYLRGSIKSQISKVFLIPCVLGAGLIYTLYVMIIYFNDNALTPTDIQVLFNCLLVVAILSLGLWGFYRYTLNKVRLILHI